MLCCWSAAMDPTCGVTVLSLLMQSAMPPGARTNHKRATVSYKYYKGSLTWLSLICKCSQQKATSHKRLSDNHKLQSISPWWSAQIYACIQDLFSFENSDHDMLCQQVLQITFVQHAYTKKKHMLHKYVHTPSPVHADTCTQTYIAYPAEPTIVSCSVSR